MLKNCTLDICVVTTKHYMLPHVYVVLCLCMQQTLLESWQNELIMKMCLCVTTGGQESSRACAKTTTMYFRGLMGCETAIKIETMW